MNILHVSRGQVKITPQATGFEGHIFHISKHTAQLGHRVTILDRRYSRKDSAVEYLDDIEVVRLDAKQIHFGRMPRLLSLILNELNQLLFSRKVSDYIRKRGEQFDVIHLHLTLMGNILAQLHRKLRRKMIYTCHVNLWGASTNQLGLISKLTLALDSFLMRRVSRVIAQSEEVKERFISRGKVRPQRISIVPEGVDVQLFNPNINADEIKTKYGLKGKVVVLFVGRLSRTKGIEYLVKAANILVNDWGYRDVIFLLVGPYQPPGAIDQPIDMEELLRFMDDNQLRQNVVFIGDFPHEELRKFYVACDIFVLPSIVEIFGLVVTEALASGRPVVGTRVGAIPAQVRNGWNGFLIDPGDELQIAEKIRYLIENPDERIRMGANGRRYVEEEFDWKKVATRYSSIYQELGKDRND
ncbi:glycosyltransferase family 4 protein [Dehalococcoidia bacterium]|nr:glycosyltransferase family 4 protein [Dehalococcoidia bacterium]